MEPLGSAKNIDVGEQRCRVREIPGRDLNEIPHPMMIDSMRRLAQHVREKPGSVRFIHLNHTNPALHDADVIDAVQRAGFLIATEGERLRF